MNNFNINQLTEQDIARRLQNKIPPTHDIPTSKNTHQFRHAGVLIPFVRIEQSWHLLFIRRSEFEHDMHSGQVAFAGGKYEAIDTCLQTTALREAHEEIGIKPQDVRVLGQLSQHYTISHFQVTPTVGIVPWPYPLQLDKQEVAHAFTIPLEWLSNPSNHKVQHQQRSKFHSPVPVVYFKRYKRELLWGVTARMTLSLISTLMDE